MQKKDLKRYSVYLPTRWEHENIFHKIESLIPGWCGNVWFSKFVLRHSCKVFWGEKQHIRVPEKDGKTFRYIPIDIWLKLSADTLDESAWNWIREQRKVFGTPVKAVKHTASNTEKSNMLDL